MDFHGFSYFHGFSWIFMDLHGFPGFSLILGAPGSIFIDFHWFLLVLGAPGGRDTGRRMAGGWPADGRRMAAGKPPGSRRTSGGFALQAGGQEAQILKLSKNPSAAPLCLGNE